MSSHSTAQPRIVNQTSGSQRIRIVSNQKVQFQGLCACDFRVVRVRGTDGLCKMIACGHKNNKDWDRAILKKLPNRQYA